MHDWGGEWPYWQELYKAQAYIGKMFCRITKRNAHIKEKYGTLRYGYTYLWLTTKQDTVVFAKIIKKAVKKFPNVAGEVVNDLVTTFSGDYDAGWCAGVLYMSSGSEWTSSLPKDSGPDLFKKYFNGGGT
jgi:hypothetical protein